MKPPFLIYLLTSVFLLFAQSGVWSNTYYLSPEGNDRGSGERAQPWASLAHANQQLRAGDTLVILPGDYQGQISPVNNGAPGAPVLYRAREPRTVRITPQGSRPLVDLNGTEHLVIEGLDLDGEERVVWIMARGCYHLTLKNCVMVSDSLQTIISESSHVWLLDNNFASNRPRGDMVHVLWSDKVVMEGNSFSMVGHCPLRVQASNHVVIRSNVFRNDWGRNYEFWASGRILVEHNIITLARDSGGSADSRAKNLYDDSIFRYNRAFGNLHVPLNTGSYIWSGVTQTGLHRAPFRAINSRFYHNTITDNLGEGWQLNGLNVSANVFQNNIFYMNDRAGSGLQVNLSDQISGDNRFVHNVLAGNERGQRVVQFGDRRWTASEANDNTLEVGGFWSVFIGNVDVDPQFLDSANRDFRLQSGSEAIDAGRALAVAVGSGTGYVLPVTDGYPFYDGFGIEGEQGDLIAIGRGDNVARVMHVELRYFQPALLHLDREVSWTDEMPVSMPWAGEAPDPGAYEHGLTHPDRIIARALPVTVIEGEPIQFSVDVQGDVLDGIRWDFEDGHFSDALDPVHTFESPGHYGVTVRASFADGRRAVDAVFIMVSKDDERGAAMPWVEVDFEDATYRATWGHLFKFYRGHQTGADRVERPGGRGHCMYIFHEPGKRNQTAAQIAPGLWEIDENPMVRFDYRIPQGVPVAIELSTFGAEGSPERFIIGGTGSRATRGEDLDLFPLKDDGQWHAIEMDLRKLRETYPDLNYLRQFLFFTNWRSEGNPHFWFDRFSIGSR